ncbi:MAG TPA: hypothetical protein PLS24_09420, partial [Sedimentisphaerales bacterium]|nr:hypothetical protein [Sedimentisphaerales bacterium]
CPRFWERTCRRRDPPRGTRGRGHSRRAVQVTRIKGTRPARAKEIKELRDGKDDNATIQHPV